MEQIRKKSCFPKLLPFLTQLLIDVFFSCFLLPKLQIRTTQSNGQLYQASTAGSQYKLTNGSVDDRRNSHSPKWVFGVPTRALRDAPIW